MTIPKMSRHIENVRRIVLDAAEKLDRESFLDRQKGMASIRDILVHLMDSEDYWAGTVIFQEKRQKFLPDKYENVPALRKNWDTIHERTRRLILDISGGAVSQERAVKYGEDKTADVATVLLHLFTHELLHLGQVCLLMRQHGYEPPDLDLL